MKHPLVLALFHLMGAYFGLSLIARWHAVAIVVTLVAGLFAATVWLIRFEAAQAQRARLHPAGRRWVDFVAETAREPLPRSAGTSAPAPSGQRLVHDGQFLTATRELRETIRGHDNAIGVMMDHLRLRTRLRESRSEPDDSPLALFLCIGAGDLGKRSLAAAMGEVAFGPGAVTLIDAAQPVDVIASIAACVHRNPAQAIIVENAAGADPRTMQQLASAATGQRLASVSLARTLIFLLVHRAIPTHHKRNDAPDARQTMLVDSMAGDLGLDRRLIWLSCLAEFSLPDAQTQAEIALLMMKNECERHGVTLTYVEPEFVAREVMAVGSAGGFHLLPGRIARRLQRPISAALASGSRRVELVPDRTLRPPAQIRKERLT